MSSAAFVIDSLMWKVLQSHIIVFTLSILTPQLLTILVLKFEQVQFTTRWKLLDAKYKTLLRGCIIGHRI